MNQAILFAQLYFKSEIGYIKLFLSHDNMGKPAVLASIIVILLAIGTIGDGYRFSKVGYTLFHQTNYKVNVGVKGWDLKYEGINPCEVMASVRSWESMQDIKKNAYKALI